MRKYLRRLSGMLALGFLLCPVTVRADSGRKQLALTFDDGPSIHTERLLDFLKEQGIHATFFLVGDRVPNYPETVRREAAEGHELGYHSYSHNDQKLLSSERIFGDFCRSNGELYALTGQEYSLWRAPGGSFNKRVLEAIPLPHVHWSADTRDWETKNAAKVCSAILESAGDGVIILLHDLFENVQTLECVEMLIPALREQGYEFVTVTELFDKYGIDPRANKYLYTFADQTVRRVDE